MLCVHLQLRPYHFRFLHLYPDYCTSGSRILLVKAEIL